VNVTCPDCRSIFRIDPAKVPTAGVRARCSVCGGVFAVSATAARADVPVAVAAPERADTGSPVGQQAAAATPPAPQRAVPTERPAEPAADVPAIWGSPETVPAARTAAPVADVPPVPAAPSAAPMAPPPEPTPVAAPVTGAGTAPVAAAMPAAEAPPRRPVNPYLSNDPGQKARRLARALVSDLIAYHPQKREEGLRAGTLKQLFRDEIRKSWEEYVEQVGVQVAESTPHFQDALNDLLAGGRKVF
jgi:predicted Zn finger-like uncharacterized protein